MSEKKETVDALITMKLVEGVWDVKIHKGFDKVKDSTVQTLSHLLRKERQKMRKKAILQARQKGEMKDGRTGRKLG